MRNKQTEAGCGRTQGVPTGENAKGKLVAGAQRPTCSKPHCYTLPCSTAKQQACRHALGAAVQLIFSQEQGFLRAYESSSKEASRCKPSPLTWAANRCATACAAATIGFTGAVGAGCTSGSAGAPGTAAPGAAAAAPASAPMLPTLGRPGAGGARDWARAWAARSLS